MLAEDRKKNYKICYVIFEIKKNKRKMLSKGFCSLDASFNIMQINQ
jgi:hypothetical protein